MKVTSRLLGGRDNAISLASSLGSDLQPLTSQDNALCICLWIIWVKSLVSACVSVDERGCGYVDNTPIARSGQVAGLRCHVAARPGTLADLTLSDRQTPGLRGATWS